MRLRDCLLACVILNTDTSAWDQLIQCKKPLAKIYPSHALTLQHTTATIPQKKHKLIVKPFKHYHLRLNCIVG